MSQPQHFLVQILVTINADGSFTTTVRSYFDGTVLSKPLQVNLGDQVAWLVQVTLPNGRKSLPYSLGFDDKRFFGVSSLEVPAGGTSPYLTVHSLKGHVNYTLNVTGVGCVFDPEIQSGGDSTFENPDLVPTFTVTWDTAAQTMTYTSEGNPYPTPLPLKVALTQSVQFQATNTAGPVTAFTISFLNNSNGWATPFDPQVQTFVAPDNVVSIGALPVDDPNDAGGSFPFQASLVDNGTPKSFPPGAYIKLTM